MMKLSVGIVGLPNVGKSTLFNLLTNANVESSNYPFCTIDPNIGEVPVPDNRLDEMALLTHAKKKIPAFVRFVDIAGLVEGASEGQGLGNQFLSHIRDVQLVLHVVRLFKKEDVVHIGEVNPIRDLQIILTEFRLKDIELLYRYRHALEKKQRTGDKKSITEFQFVSYLYDCWNNEKVPDLNELSHQQKEWLAEYRLLLLKSAMILINLDESQLNNYQQLHMYQEIVELAKSMNYDLFPMAIKAEQELSDLTHEELIEFLASINIEEPGLNRLIRMCYQKLGLITFFTANEISANAWTIVRDLPLPQAAGRIHTDFQKGFIRGEVIGYNDFIVNKADYALIRQKGLFRVEGKKYLVQDGDVINFRFNL